MKRLHILLLPVIFLLLLFLQGSFTNKTILAAENLTERQSYPILKEWKEPDEKVTSATFTAAGDVLIHSPLYMDAETSPNHYNFDPMIQDVKGALSQSDLTLVNQETMIGGVQLGLSTYPAFNSPFEVADSLKNAGIDIVSMANNHALDKGEKGILNAVSHYHKLCLPYLGAYASQKDADTIRVIEKDGIRFGFLAYTYGTNGYKVPKNKPYLVSLINKPKMAKDLAKLKKIADVSVVMIHWGTEYERLPNKDQRELARFLSDHGADLIMGSHPHVLQPMEWLKQKDGKKSLVVYSLGNFLSGQSGEYKVIGGIISIEVKKISRGNYTAIKLMKPVFLPTITVNKEHHHYQVEKLSVVNRKKAEEIKKYVLQWIP
ncbi:CapA family protein [Metabacillus sp. RGM 3146]|uniref:CapA family protein n=1 Tax=Metabacillus sp. RGM 3146 TaxID=3401092 RepID=UPI003B9BBD4C